jgi:hypothetical protein
VWVWVRVCVCARAQVWVWGCVGAIYMHFGALHSSN